ncbi:hypothetical protein [Engelhardtia mirabilis]|uniref:Uncharacterized protein n=1 Tax=Engelhardtia mirabilis TaxID=2528011 RepID=A0A518BHX5_9BACT|nr:hypothetical protein Pla133_16420 [Planctomycetes bacterium Pla133]QDV00892.1 hypothetical protein Pla86_16410 [Planctomycetes bacterium Pla86]
MPTLAPLIAACIRRIDAGLDPCADDLEQLAIALDNEPSEQELLSIGRLISDPRRANHLGELVDAIHRAFERTPRARRRFEQDVAVPGLRRAPQSAPRDRELVGLYAWTEHGDETSFALTNTVLLLLAPEGHFARGPADPAAKPSDGLTGQDAGDRGVWSSARGRLLLASDVGRHESYAFVRKARSLHLTDDHRVRRLLRPITD